MGFFVLCGIYNKHHKGIMNINEYRNRFYNLLESKLGNVKPLICEIEIGEDKIDLSQTYLSPEKMKNLKDTNKSNVDSPFPSLKIKIATYISL